MSRQCLHCGRGYSWLCPDCRKRHNERVKRLRDRFVREWGGEA